MKRLEMGETVWRISEVAETTVALCIPLSPRTMRAEDLRAAMIEDVEERRGEESRVEAGWLV